MLAAERSPEYSVIIPAFNAERLIPSCLAALEAQSVPADRFELIVVDDGSSDDTLEVARRAARRARVLHIPHAGPAAARNAGAREARGRLLLFTDADCEPATTWIHEITRCLEEDRRVAAVRGVYRTRQRDPIARIAQIEFETKYAAMRRCAAIDFLDTASAAFRREVFWEAGGFDAAFPTASNEDTALSFWLAERGHRLVLADRAVVFHRHPTSLVEYLKRKWRHGYWRVRVYRKHPAKLSGDSYTPRSMQVQFASVMLALVSLTLPWRRPLVAICLAVFCSASLPFVRAARTESPIVAAAVVPVLLLRAVALAAGLAIGCAALLLPAIARWLNPARLVQHDKAMNDVTPSGPQARSKQ